jgi:hypothetical protein
VGKYCRNRQATDDDIIRRTRFASWIPEATNTHSEYVILIAFPLQQWLRESNVIVRYTLPYCGPGSSVGIATELRAGRPGIESATSLMQDCNKVKDGETKRW